MFKKAMHVLLGAFVVLASAGLAQAQSQEWRLIDPSGVVRVEPSEPALRLDSLEGKTVVLRWNNKHNGNVVLERIAERLQEAVPSLNIIKTYEQPDFRFVNNTSGSAANSQRIIEAIAAFKPDLVIASTAD